jgi:hypothetical protein
MVTRGDSSVGEEHLFLLFSYTLGADVHVEVVMFLVHSVY